MMTRPQAAAAAIPATQAAAGNATAIRIGLCASGPRRASTGSARPPRIGPAIAAGVTSSRASTAPVRISCRRDAPRARSSAASASRWLLSSETARASVAPAMTSRMRMPTASWDLATTTACSRPASRAGSPVVTTTLCSPAALPSPFSPGPSEAASADRLPAPILAVSRLTDQDAELTGMPRRVMAAWLVTSEG